MLDRARLFADMKRIEDDLFPDTASERKLVFEAWKKLCADPTFVYRVREATVPWSVPTWEGDVGAIQTIARRTDPYRALSVDGSQIYPDRHQGGGCFLINIGSTILDYGVASPGVQFDSIPSVHTIQTAVEDGVELSHDYVNAFRQQCELQGGLDLWKQHDCASGANDVQNQLLLFDGSLVFWNLEAKDNAMREIFLPRYLSILLQLRNAQIPTAWYISAPKSRELTGLVKLFLCDFDANNADRWKMVDRVSDAAIAGSFLEPGQRTGLFCNQANVSQLYPDDLRPFFFYLHVGEEIGRVELPAWMARSEALVDTVTGMILDQCAKGWGYPVAIAESHERAVVKGPDRDFFYHLLAKLSMDRGIPISCSQKLARKRGMGI